MSPTITAAMPVASRIFAITRAPVDVTMALQFCNQLAFRNVTLERKLLVNIHDGNPFFHFFKILITFPNLQLVQFEGMPSLNADQDLFCDFTKMAIVSRVEFDKNHCVAGDFAACRFAKAVKPAMAAKI